MPINTIVLSVQADKNMRDTLLSHLSVFERKGVLSIWHQDMTVPGTQWQEVLEEHLYDAHLVLACISAKFLADDEQIAYLRECFARQEQRLCIVVAILFDACLWGYTFDDENAIILPRNQKVIARWSNKASAYTQVVTELKAVIERISRRFLS